jgi:tRNA nucleotidyltransferase (CCA-adding enzyme)
MHIVLTHEQADFDALASLLGAYLLDETSIPVLPRRINRNVQAFLTLYGMDLPFIDPRDLPNENIEMVTLVDTQSMVSIKGVGPATQVTLIDHHPLRENLPPHWSILREETGATTTLIIEALRERDGMLTPVQATLLLLGIYEDTGSLTYTRTTARDLRAAAYLLEQGANLHIAANFLNHPLSTAQQTIYDHLRAKVEYHNVYGHTVVITTGDAQDMDEELSTIAHKLRDLLDPDALFVLVTTRGGVQLIARSTSDQIDVSEFVAHFGGGGHERAAAGLIRGQNLDSVRSELIKLLPRYVRPAITVAQIMSREPQLLAPWTPVEDAAQRMRRFGYEGYPVVQNGRVVGLLTRRAVDRAISHNLHLTASSLMDAGTYTVHPDDSIEHLQRLMTESGWGQVPVAHPESGEIVGIVTRTDLLKTLTPDSRLAGQTNLAERLEGALPVELLALLHAIAEIAHEQHAALYIVGGFVRDLLLNRPSLDFDLVVEGDAIKLARSITHKYGGRVTSHSRFGTAKWRLEGSTFETLQAPENQSILPLQSLDLVSARTEFYTHPSALPTVERGSIKLDLHRRDFTINTLALRLDGHHYGELHDYWGGLNDLSQGLVRVLHSLSFVDDPTRMLRAVRFEQRFGFRIEKRTLELMQEAISLLERVSGDRVRHELNHIMVEPHNSQILEQLGRLHLLEPIHPALRWDEWLKERLESLPDQKPDPDWGLDSQAVALDLKRSLAYILWFLRLTPKLAHQVSERLKMPVELRDIIQAAIGLWHELPRISGRPTSQIVTRLDEIPALARYAVFLATPEPDLRQLLVDYVQRWQKITPVHDGHYLREIGLPPGPAYRTILATLRGAWLDGEITSADQEEALLDKLLADLVP